MAKDDEKQDSGYTLEEILAEYGVDVSRWEDVNCFHAQIPKKTTFQPRLD